VASLVYLGNQIRHNSRSVEAATNHAIARARNELNIAVATNSELSEIIVRGTGDYDSLQAEERQRYNACMISNMNIFEDAYVQYSKGLASREIWEENVSVLTRTFSLPGPRNWWRDSAHFYVMDPAFRQVIESAVRKQSEAEAHTSAARLL
jgi:hypothetical protein